jgi:hypothetical protein
MVVSVSVDTLLFAPVTALAMTAVAMLVAAAVDV